MARTCCQARKSPIAASRFPEMPKMTAMTVSPVGCHSAELHCGVAYRWVVLSMIKYLIK